MADIGEVRRISTDLLRPYENNAKKHSPAQIRKIADSIREFGFLNPVLIDKDYNVIAGHGRIMAMKELGETEVPCLFVEGLTEAQRRAYILADNRLTELGDWDMDIVDQELAALRDMNFDIDLTGFELNIDTSWFDRTEKDGDARQEGNDEYNEFLDKFEQPKTTDDCYTPDNIYDVVADYVAKRFGRDRKRFVRPFYPGGDYQAQKYLPGDVVVDNPPFSILSEIVDYYLENGIKFFMFCPGLLCFNYLRKDGVCCITVDGRILYENGATVPTGFITNLFEDGTVIDNDPELHDALEAVNKTNIEAQRKNLPKYEYPYSVLTAAGSNYLSKYGEHITIKSNECMFIRELDAQKETGQVIFGAGALLSERAAAERAAAERAAAERAAAERAAAERAAAERAAAERAAATVWQLSERELELQKSLV